jgi:hypothetical protein
MSAKLSSNLNERGQSGNERPSRAPLSMDKKEHIIVFSVVVSYKVSMEYILSLQPAMP